MDQTKELLEMPREFVKDGRQFITRCSKPDKREFLRISQAVGMGFLIMGVIGYVVKLSRSNASDGDSTAEEVEEANVALQYTSRSTTSSSVAHKGIQSLEGFRQRQEDNCTNTGSGFGAYSEAFRETFGQAKRRSRWRSDLKIVHGIQNCEMATKP
ncbi:hypothetical protein D0859_15719 [Hortaea werneckii]|uniref:Protein translocase SEC61 complex gamma subunit, archaeal and eukaryotic n=1 Tax=Hortaea werneckii TaxID=91943 RepID=A0A3M7I455_HORWE|nr:hypothetical protein D0859_15719 [Hortaea werneckii]